MSSLSHSLHRNAAGTTVGNQRGRQLQQFHFRMRKAFLHLCQHFFPTSGCTCMGYTDQVIFPNTQTAQLLNDELHSSFPIAAHTHRGNAGLIRSLGQNRQQL